MRLSPLLPDKMILEVGGPGAKPPGKFDFLAFSTHSAALLWPSIDSFSRVLSPGEVSAPYELSSHPTGRTDFWRFLAFEHPEPTFAPTLFLQGAVEP